MVDESFNVAVRSLFDRIDARPPHEHELIIASVLAAWILKYHRVEKLEALGMLCRITSDVMHHTIGGSKDDAANRDA